MSTVDAPPAPAVLAGLAAARSALRRTAEAPVWCLSDDELGAAVAQAVAAQVEGCLAAVLAEADGWDLAGRRGAPGTTAWLRDTHRLTPRAAAAAVLQAAGLYGSVGPAGQPAARIQLLEDAATCDAGALRRLGAYIWEVVDPQAADATEAGRLEAAEQRAFNRRRLATGTGPGSMKQVADERTSDQAGNCDWWVHSFLTGRVEHQGDRASQTSRSPLARASTRG